MEAHMATIDYTHPDLVAQATCVVVNAKAQLNHTHMKS
jgi:hypothetical protein